MRPVYGVDPDTFQRVIVRHMYEAGDWVRLINDRDLATDRLKLGEIYTVKTDCDERVFLQETGGYVFWFRLEFVPRQGDLFND